MIGLYRLGSFVSGMHFFSVPFSRSAAHRRHLHASHKKGGVYVEVDGPEMASGQKGLFFGPIGLEVNVQVTMRKPV